MQDRKFEQHIGNQEAGEESSRPIEHIRIQEWQFDYLDTPIELSQGVTSEIHDVVRQWQQVFPKEDTWVQTNFNVPSLIVRLDMTIVDGAPKVFEIEERPAGIGATYQLNPTFRDNLEQAKQGWPPIKAVVSENRRASDDHWWTEVTDNPAPEDVLIIRAEPEETNFYPLQAQSASSLRTKGDKSYGLNLGMWDHVDNLDAVDWENGSFVLKPTQGSKARDVFIYHKGRLFGEKIKGGTSTRSQIERGFAEHPEGMYRQPFYPPLRMVIKDKTHWGAVRTFFAFDTLSRDWVHLGGVWTARPNLLIHGASDAVFGPVI